MRILTGEVRLGSKLTVDTALWVRQVYPWKLANFCSAANGEFVPGEPASPPASNVYPQQRDKGHLALVLLSAQTVLID